MIFFSVSKFSLIQRLHIVIGWDHLGTSHSIGSLHHFLPLATYQRNNMPIASLHCHLPQTVSYFLKIGTCWIISMFDSFLEKNMGRSMFLDKKACDAKNGSLCVFWAANLSMNNVYYLIQFIRSCKMVISQFYHSFFTY